ncbi:MAG: hypothetical protein PHQ27_08880 [Victivallales bacterium]|nr:hypothetical protein [Victivallales bacterium]
MLRIKAGVLTVGMLVGMNVAGWARMDETLPQCRQRYGEVIEKIAAADVSGMVRYRFNINVSGEKQVVVCISFPGPEKLPVMISYTSEHPFTESQVRYMLSVNSHGRKWILQRGDRDRVCFLLEDGSRKALVRDKSVVIINVVKAVPTKTDL